jgi:hypothetical protein
MIGPAEHLVFVLIDGFGMNLVEREPPCSPFRACLAGELKSVYPSSTAPALTSLATGAWPSEHAVPGWWTYLPEAELTATILPFVDRFSQRPLAGRIDPATAFPMPSRPAALRRRLAVSPKAIAGSTYSVYSQAGAETFGYESMTSAVECIVDFLRHAAGPTYTYLYLPFIDAAEHTHGHSHPEVTRTIGRVRQRFASLVEAVRGRARIVATADHGHVEIDDARKHTLQRWHPLCELLAIPPSCEPRAPAFHVAAGEHGRFKEAFRSKFGERFALLTLDEADGLRLFGRTPLAAETRRRLGDYVAVARGLDAIIYEPTDELRAMRGFHGGLAAGEMRVPLMIA